MSELLDVPTKPRNQTEEMLLDEIILDPNLQNPNLKSRVKNYINGDHHFALVAWLHPPASMVRRSFEDETLARVTHESYDNQKPTPRIVGVVTLDDLNY